MGRTRYVALALTPEEEQFPCPSLERSQSCRASISIFALLAGRIGAEIDNVRLAGDLPERAIAAIEAALAKYKVIFFRDQSHLDDAGQERFAARLGELVAHPTNPAAPAALPFWS